LYGGIDFVVSWKRGKKRNDLVNLPCCAQKANGNIDFSEKKSKNELTQNGKRRYLGSNARGGMDESRM
jgi:hypothetical protein